MKLLLTAILILGLIPATSLATTQAAYAADGSVTHVGWEDEITEYGWTQKTRYMELNGQFAMCCQHFRATPAQNTDVTVIETVTNDLMRKVAWYGYGGPGSIGMSLVRTACAMSNANNEDITMTGRDALNEVKDLASPPSSFVLTKWSTGGTTQDLVTWTYKPNGWIDLQKASSNTAMTDGNACYSLKDATYDIYASQNDATARTNAVSSMATNADGWAKSGELEAGKTYYVREKIAPLGYALDETIYPVTVASDATTRVNGSVVYDKPQGDPAGSLLAKYDGEKTFNANNLPQGSASLALAKYQVNYYAGYYTTEAEALASGTLKRSWVMQTNEMGYVNLRGGDSTFTTKDGKTYPYKISGDTFYRSSNGDITLPRGTVTIQEVEAPEGYLLPTPNPVFVQQITSGGMTGETVSSYNAPKTPEPVKRGDISLMKYGEKTGNPENDPSIKIPLAGVDFEIINESELAVVRPDGTEAAKGDVVATISTDAQGWASSETLCPPDQNNTLAFGTYRVHEVESTVPAGYSPVEDFTVTVSEDGYIHRFILEDKTGTAIKLVKLDATTNKQVAGITSFRILDASKNPITFTSYYPNISVQSVFTTGADGSVVLPEKLLAGTYYLSEVKAPWGYLINDELVQFVVDSSTVGTFAKPLEVKIADNPARGRIEITKTDAETGKPIAVPGTTFEVRAKEDIITQDGTVRVLAGTLIDTVITNAAGVAKTKELYLGNYEVVETKAPAGYLINTQPQSVTVSYVNQSTPVSVSTLNVADTPAKGKITISKTDAESGNIVTTPGARFNVIATKAITTPDGTVRAQAGAIVDTIETDATGTAKTKALYLGDYKVTEIQAPSGYVLSGGEVPVSLTYKDQVTELVYVHASVSNSPAKGIIDITKYDRTTGKPIKTAGIEYDVIAATDIIGPDNTVRARTGDIVDHVISGENGKASTKQLYLGSYLVRETKAPAGYLLNNATTSVTLAYKGQLESIVYAGASIHDEPARGIIEVSKADADTGMALLQPGIEFDVVAASDIVTAEGTVRAYAGTVVDHLVTNNLGTAKTKALYLGDYEIHETTAPLGYILNQTPTAVSLTYKDQSTSLVYTHATVTDDTAKGVITVAKADKETGKKVEVAGIEFDIVATRDVLGADGKVRVHKDEVVDHIKTRSNGEATTKPLYLSTYRVIETKAPEGYLCDADPIDVTLSYVDQYTPIVYATAGAADTPVKGIIEIMKNDKETDKSVAVAGIEYDVIATTNITTPEGTVRASAGQVVDHVVSTSSGKATTKQLYLGSYLVRETKAPEGYVLDGADVNVTLAWADQNTKVVYTSTTIKDTPQKGKITLSKTDAENSDTPIAGAIYEVRAKTDITTPDGTVRAQANEIVSTLTTDTDGLAATNLLYLGDYMVRETQAPAGYLLDKSIYDVTLARPDQTVQVTTERLDVADTPTHVDIHKIRLCSEQGLSGVKIGYWNINDELRVEPFAGKAAVALKLTESDFITTSSISLSSVQNDGQPTADTFTLTFGDEGIYASSDVPYGTYDLVAHYTYNGSEEMQEQVLTRVEVAADTNKVLFETVASTGMSDAGIQTTWHTKRTSAYVDKTKMNILTTDDQGKIALTHLAPGTYGFAEIETLPGYVLNTTTQYLTIEDDGCIEGKDRGELTFKNDYTKLEISKTDITTGVELPGNTLRLYHAPAEDSAEPYGDLVEEWVSTDTPHLIDTLAAGHYVLHEQIPATGYLQAQDVTFTVAETGEIQRVVMDNDYTKTDIVKVDAETRATLDGAKLALIDVHGSYLDPRAYTEKSLEVEEVLLDENGKISDMKPAADKTGVVYCWNTTKDPLRFNGLLPGDYEVVEIKAPAGYEIADNLAFEVPATGEVTTVEITDRRTPIPEMPTTGDRLLKQIVAVTLITLGVATLLLSAARIIGRLRKNKSEESE